MTDRTAFLPRCRTALAFLATLVLACLLSACGGGGSAADAGFPPDGPAGLAAIPGGALPASAPGVAATDRKVALAASDVLTEEQALAYIASYSDLVAAFGTDTALARRHYAEGGKAEGRTITFKPYEYIASYPGLISTFGTDAETATRQYIRVGISQGRSVRFDPFQYLARNPDLVSRLGVSPESATLEYITTGHAANRPTEFDTLAYIARYADLIVAYGENVTAAILHYINGGLSEGRTALFDARQYLANYADLAASYGDDLQAATRHFIGQGIKEGRTDAIPNRAPTAVITVPEQVVIPIGSTLTLDGSASSDPDRNPLRHAWTLRTRPDGSTAQLGSPASPAAALSPDVGGLYVVDLVVDDGQLRSAVASLEVRAGTAVSGMLGASGSWSLQHSPIILSGLVGIPSGVTLTIAAGVEVIGNGHVIQVQGSLLVEGSSEQPVQLKGVRIVPAGTVAAAGHLIDIRHADLQGGTLYAPSTSYGSLVLTDSRVDIDEFIYLWYPTATSRIERNRFERGRISFGTAGQVQVVIKNNRFGPAVGSPTIENWAAYDTSGSDVKFNTFTATGTVAVSLPAGYGNAKLDAASNHWSTTDRNTIGQMIFDKNDDLTSAGFVNVDPVLDAAHPATPP